MGFLVKRAALLLCLLQSMSPTVSSSSTLISESSSKLPMSLSMIITDLEAESVAKVTTACLVTSRSVTSYERTSLVQSLFGIDDSEEELAKITAFGKKLFDDDADGIAVANPGTKAPANEVASTAVACGGTIVYVPSPYDLHRGEGLFDFLAPAIERVHKAHDASGRKAVLVVVVTGDIATAKAQLEQAAASILTSIVQPGSLKKAATLEDVFDTVQYISSETDSESFENILSHLGGACAPDEARTSVASTAAADFSLANAVPGLKAAHVVSPQDLAAARQLGPAARSILVSTLQSVKDIASDQATGEPKLVTSFGDFCDASVKGAIEQLDGIQPPTNAIAKQIKSNLKDELYAELGDLFDQQLKQCQLASFEEFRRKLSQLRVSPNLASDMEKCGTDSSEEFGNACKKLQPKGAAYSASASKIEYSRSLKEYCSERLLVARASGQYKPVPRKGVTVGFHWLLPKPFGNDFRQEPWMVHATDNLVYIPKDKITDINPDDVKAGNWRSKIVPSPAGNDILYVQ